MYIVYSYNKDNYVVPRKFLKRGVQYLGIPWVDYFVLNIVTTLGTVRY